MDRQAWHAAVHGVAKSQTQLSEWTELIWTEVVYSFCFYFLKFCQFCLTYLNALMHLEITPSTLQLMSLIITNNYTSSFPSSVSLLRFIPFTYKHKVRISEVAQSCPTLCDPVDSSLHQAPLSMGFSWQEYWSGLPFPSPGNLPDPGIAPTSPALLTDTLPSEPPGKSIYKHMYIYTYVHNHYIIKYSYYFLQIFICQSNKVNKQNFLFHCHSFFLYNPFFM